MDENENIIPPDRRTGEPTWLDVTDNDRVLARQKNIEGITNNHAVELEVLSTTLNHDFLRIKKGNHYKWIKTDEWELIERLPPILPKSE